MIVETWDRTSLREQEGIIGRTKAEGAPLSGGSEATDPDFGAPGRATASRSSPETAHVRLAHPTPNGGARMLRRGYTFTDGDDGLGRLDAGLFFVAFVRDARTQFVPMQTALARIRQPERVPRQHRGLRPVCRPARRALDRRRRQPGR